MELPNDISGLQAFVAELLEQVRLQAEEIAVLKAEVRELRAENEQLKSRLNQNSHNSHRPPSSDGLGKKPAFPKGKGKGHGGQKGHQGRTLKMVSRPDEIIDLKPMICSCGQSLCEVESAVVERRQVFELPDPRLCVKEYRKLVCPCPVCGSVNEGVFPEKVTARVQYGSGVRALATLLNVGYKIPFKKVRGIFADLFGYQLNEATQLSAQQTAYDRLARSESAICQTLIQSPVNHFDETGLRVEGKLHWLHTCSNAGYTYLFVHPNRGRKAFEAEASLLPEFQGWAVHDCWKSYFGFEACRHATCGAHLLRELTAASERGSRWTRSMKRYLLTLYRLSQYGTGALPQKLQEKARKLYSRILDYALLEEPPPHKIPGKRGRPKASKAYNLLQRLIQYQEAVLAFAFYSQVPFTNNQAERDLRPAKIKQKVAGSFRTLAGAHIYARIQGVISTIRKNQLNVFKELRAAFADDQYLCLPAPQRC